MLKLSILSLLFLLFCAGAGYASLKAIRPSLGAAEAENRYLVLFFSVSLGLLIVISGLFLLGLVGWLNLFAVLATGIALSVASSLFLLRGGAGFDAIKNGWTSADAVVLAALFAVVILLSLHPPGAAWDDTMYHLPLARFYLDHGSLAVNEFLRFPLFPNNMDLAIALGLMLGGDVGAQAFATLPLFVISLGLIGASMWLTGSPIIGALSAATLLYLGPVQVGLGYAFVDNGLALFCWGACLAMAIWVQPPIKENFGWLIISGLLAGAAVGTKYFGLVFGGLLGLYLLVMQRNLKATTVYGLAMLAAGIWWYFRSFIISGDPIHPAGGNIFGHFLWDAEDLLGQKAEQATHGVSPRSLDIVGALHKAWAGILAIGLGSVLIPNLSPALKLFRFIFLSYLAFWFFVTQVERYLAPVYALGLLLTFYVIFQIVWLKPAIEYLKGGKRAAELLVFAILVASTLDRAIPERMSEAKWQNHLEERPGYKLFSKASEMASDPGARLVHIGFENAVYFFKGIAIGDWFGPGRYREMPLNEPARMAATMQRFGASMLAISKAFKYDQELFKTHFDTVMSDKFGDLLALKK
jgi:hypothetical protein